MTHHTIDVCQKLQGNSVWRVSFVAAFFVALLLLPPPGVVSGATFFGSRDFEDAGPPFDDTSGDGHTAPAVGTVTRDASSFAPNDREASLSAGAYQLMGNGPSGFGMGREQS